MRWYLHPGLALVVLGALIISISSHEIIKVDLRDARIGLIAGLSVLFISSIDLSCIIFYHALQR